MNRKLTPSSCVSLFEREPTDEDTLIILGSPRGGTSMISGLLRLLGIDMGNDVNDANNEDNEFTAHHGNRIIFERRVEDPVRSHEINRIIQVIVKNNSEKSRWGWKDPLSTYYIKDVVDHLRSPRFICVTRDPVAVVGRQVMNRNSNDASEEEFQVHFRHALRHYTDMYEFIFQSELPTLFISYERATRHPRATINEIAGFCRVPLPADREEYEGLVSYILPERNTGSITAEIKSETAKSGSRPPLKLDAEGQTGYELKLSELGRSVPMGVGEVRRLLKAAGEASAKKDFVKVEELIMQAIAGLIPWAPELGRHPTELVLNDFYGEDRVWPKRVHVFLQLFFRLGMNSLQRGDHELAYWLFRAVVYFCERNPQAYRRNELRPPYWAALFHIGFAARALGRLGIASEVFARIKNAEASTLPVDKFASQLEKEDFKRYLQRVESSSL